jgi:hypothetical protein
VRQKSAVIGPALQSAFHAPTAAITLRNGGLAALWKEETMNKTLNGALVALALAGATLAISTPASAQDVGVGVHVGGVGIGVGVGVGDVAYGYQDGYWDNGHHWHNWSNKREMRNYRNAHRDQYNDYRHDRDPDQGWHRPS